MENNENIKTPALVGKHEAAAYLSVSEAYIMRLARQGRVRSYRVGRWVRFDLTDLDAYVATCVRS